MLGLGLPVAGSAQSFFAEWQRLRQMNGGLDLWDPVLSQLVTSSQDESLASLVHSPMDPRVMYGPGTEWQGYGAAIAALNDGGGFQRALLMAQAAVADAGSHTYTPPSGASSRPPRPQTLAELARSLVPHVRNHRRPSDFLDEVIDDLVALGRVRPGYQRATGLRRLKEFLSRYVYGVLVPIEDLSPEVQRGRLTGGTQRVRSNGSRRVVRAPGTAR